VSFFAHFFPAENNIQWDFPAFFPVKMPRDLIFRVKNKSEKSITARAIYTGA
jgi:hypothetical protein